MKDIARHEHRGIGEIGCEELPVSFKRYREVSESRQEKEKDKGTARGCQAGGGPG